MSVEAFRTKEPSTHVDVVAVNGEHALVATDRRLALHRPFLRVSNASASVSTHFVRLSKVATGTKPVIRTGFRLAFIVQPRIGVATLVSGGLQSMLDCPLAAHEGQVCFALQRRDGAVQWKGEGQVAKAQDPL